MRFPTRPVKIKSTRSIRQTPPLPPLTECDTQTHTVPDKSGGRSIHAITGGAQLLIVSLRIQHTHTNRARQTHLEYIQFIYAQQAPEKRCATSSRPPSNPPPSLHRVDVAQVATSRRADSGFNEPWHRTNALRDIYITHTRTHRSINKIPIPIST